MKIISLGMIVINVFLNLILLVTDSNTLLILLLGTRSVLADEAFPAVDLIKLEPTNIKVSCDHPDVLRLIKMTNLPTWGTRSKRSTKRKRIKKSAKPGSKKGK